MPSAQLGIITERPYGKSRHAKKDGNQKTARDLGIDENKGAESLERAFSKIVPSRRPALKREGRDGS
jgi:hypothetical protein